jgi:hypothetical protein
MQLFPNHTSVEAFSGKAIKGVLKCWEQSIKFIYTLKLAFFFGCNFFFFGPKCKFFLGAVSPTKAFLGIFLRKITQKKKAGFLDQIRQI